MKRLFADSYASWANAIYPGSGGAPTLWGHIRPDRPLVDTRGYLTVRTGPTNVNSTLVCGPRRKKGDLKENVIAWVM